MYTKSKKALEQGGLRLLLKRATRKAYVSFIKPFMPRKDFRLFNGVKVEENMLFEETLDLTQQNIENFEEKNIEAIQEYLKKDEDITIIGGGYGVTAKYAHQITEDGNGIVKVIEASKSQIEKMQDVKKWNDLDIELIHGLVGKEVNIYGEKGQPERIDINEIDSEVIQMDIEGSECSVLEEMTDGPPKIIIESHGSEGCSSENVENKLKDLDYDTEILGPERDEQRFVEEDVQIIVGNKKQQNLK